MFERRVKVFFVLLVAMTGLLLLRAAHLQVIRGDEYRERAAESLVRSTLVETVRGRILDRKGRVLAADEPCIDAAVHYRAIERNPKWVRARALERLGSAYRRERDADARARMLDEAIAGVHADLDAMWRELAAATGRSVEEVAEAKLAVHHRVGARRRYLWYKGYARAVAAAAAADKTSDGDGGGSAPWYREWGIVRSSEPDLDAFRIEVAEEEEAHVIVPAIDPEAHNRLKKQADRFPGLVLRPSKHRRYPYGSAAAHVIGTMAPVTAEDLRSDPNDGDELREYYPNDTIGRWGVEALCEQALRGKRGLVRRVLGGGGQAGGGPGAGAAGRVDPERGRDVRLTIDIELQASLEEAFRRVTWVEKGAVVEEHEMHGAAVVIDVASGEVLALVSAPTFDLNRYDQEYAKLVADEFNRPLINRATFAQYEPGSTVKPIVGAGAVSQGLLRAGDGIECTGYLLDEHGQPIRGRGRCWTASRFASTQFAHLVPHHQLPSLDPHPTGFLTLADAIQRSCNIYFQVVGTRLGAEGLAYWYDQFGLGRRTGIGLPELPGRIPRATNLPRRQLQSLVGFSSIGQGQVVATPLQMANVAATFARDGVWVRPRVVADGRDAARATAPAAARADDEAGPDRVRLPLSREALAAVQEGMLKVVETRAGSAHVLRRADLAFRGKTGTAQTPPFYVVQRDGDGKPVLGADGRPVRVYPEISTREKPNPQLPWYRGTGTDGKQLHHAWFIGYAPAERPTVAFAILLEYGGSGGADAAPVSRALLDALVERGYVPTRRPPRTAGEAVGMAPR